MSNIRKGPWSKTQINGTDVASPEVPEYHAAMTDITRQQVSDMLAASEAKVDARLANFDTSIKTGFAELRADMAKQTAEIHKGTADLIKWAATLAIAIVGATVGLLTYINKSSEKPTPPTQPATVIVTVPGATTAPAQAPVAK